MNPTIVRQKKVEFEKLYYRGHQFGPLIHLHRIEPGCCSDSDLENFGKPYPSVIGRFWPLFQDYCEDYGLSYAGELSELLDEVLELGHGETLKIQLNEHLNNGSGWDVWEITRIAACLECGGLIP